MCYITTASSNIDITLVLFDVFVQKKGKETNINLFWIVNLIYEALISFLK